jgi:hypothetical protein
MADPREMLAMLTPHGVRIGHIPGGVPTLTPQDIAAAIGLELTEEEGAYMLSRYSKDMQQYRDARVFWFERVMAEAKRNGWKSADPLRFKGLSDATLAEWMDDGNCKGCDGVGTQMTETGRVENCPVCDGTRRRWPSERQTARAIGGISVQAYRETWIPRVGWCRRWLASMDIDCAIRLGRRLRP